MNANSKHWILSFLVVLTLILLYTSCSDNSTNPNHIQHPDTQTLNISDIKNIIWIRNETGYEPFYLIYDEGRFFGYDGCNWYGGLYETRNDSIFPADVSHTERACNVNTLSIQHLIEPYRIEITKNKLLIFAMQTTFTYKSDVTDSIENSPLIRNWILTASTDPEFDEIQSQQLTPVLSFDDNRGFKIAWYCVPDNKFGCDEIFGIFGIGPGSKILFYKTGWHNHAQGLDFMNRILNSSYYSVNTDTLILFNENSSTRFEFEAINKIDQ